MTAHRASATYDVIVVGLGAMGSATTWHLARAGVRVLGVDRFSPPHPMGSTHGDTRITRQAIGEGSVYVPFVLRSHELWREIEEQTGTDLLTVCGGLILGRDSGVNTHGTTDFLGQTIAAAEQFGIAHEVLTADSVRERFAQFRLVGDETGYWEPGAGFVRPEACVAAQLELAEREGATLRRDERLVRFEPGSHGVTVITSRGRYSAGKVILSVGAWLPRMLDSHLARQFAVRRQVMHWFDMKPPHHLLTPEHCPVYIWEVGATEWFYGFPAVDGPGGGMKVAAEQSGPPVNPDAVDREVPVGEATSVFDSIVGRRMPQLRRTRVKSVSCLYTTTTDSTFVVDWHPDSDRVLLVSPCSGHGFKHSAAIGETAAQLVTDGRATLDVDAFSLRRFDTALTGRSSRTPVLEPAAHSG